MTDYRERVQKWYRSKRWQRMRARQLRAHPYCQCPHHKGKGERANVADHIEPHKGDPRLFWNPRNLQSMAQHCHDKYKASQERGGHGFNAGCDEHGEPLSQHHPWNS